MKIKTVFDYIKRNIPYYKSNCADAANFNDLPIMYKQTIRNNYRMFITDEIEPSKRRDLVDALERGSNQAKGWYNEILVAEDVVLEETTGTSGIPFMCAKTLKERNQLALILWRERLKRDHNVTIKNFFQFSHIGRGKENPDAYNYEVNHIRKLYEKIQEYKIRWIHGSPNAFLNHIKVMKEYNINFDLDSLKFIECTGSFLNITLKKIIEDFFDVTVINEYGCIETWPIALSNQSGDLVLNDRAVYFELVDNNGKIITEKNKQGNVVVTTLHNRMMPLVRYWIGDFAEYNNFAGEGERTIILHEGREVNIIKGIAEIKFGNIEFKRIVKTALLYKKNVKLRYIQFIQNSKNKFSIYINNFPEVYDFLIILINIMKKEFSNEILVQYKILSDIELEQKNHEKPNIFLSLCEKDV